MQNLSDTTAAVTTVKDPSINELHMLKAKHSKKGTAAEPRRQSICKSCYYCGAMLSQVKKECPASDAECNESEKKGQFKGSCRSKKEEMDMSRTKDAREMQKSARVYELKAQATMESWI